MSSDPAAENLLERLKNRFSGNKGEDKRDHLVNEIEHLHKYKEITDNEFSMLEGILDFQDKMVREVMVPRPDAFMVDAAIPFQDNLDEILRQPYSRIPVYMKDKDKIVGIIHIRTVLRKARKIGFESLDYDNVMSEPLFAPETAELGELLVEMQQTQRQLAILLDEYGGVVGLATIEDLIEENLKMNKPINLRTLSWDKEQVLCSIDSDIVILDAIKKVIVPMVTANQALLLTPQHNKYLNV